MTVVPGLGVGKHHEVSVVQDKVGHSAGVLGTEVQICHNLLSVISNS